MKYENNDLTIGPAFPGDEEGIVAVHKQTWLEIYPNTAAGISRNDVLSVANNFDSADSIVVWKERISGNGAKQNYVCVAKDRGRVVAFCRGKKLKEHNQLSAIYILPEYRSQGIGKCLVADVFGWLGSDKKIIVTPVAYNLPAIEFYKKLGFAVVEGKSSFKELPGGKAMPLIEMELVSSGGIFAPGR